MRPDISVVMPVFNGARFLDRALRSVLSQSFQNWELLAVDDGSTDGSYELLRQYSAADSRIRAFRLEENRGPSAARNQALGQATGTVIAYLDCDDEYYPTYLEYVHHFRDKGDVLVFTYDLLDETHTILRPGEVITWEPVRVHGFLMQANIACPLGIAHRRALLEKAGLFNESLSVLEDWDLWKRFALVGAEFIFLPLKSGLYRIRGDSQARTKRVPEAIRAVAGFGSDQRPIDAAQDEEQMQQTDDLSRSIWVG